MNKQAEVLTSLWDFYNKLDILNRPKMEVELRKLVPDITHSEVELIELIKKTADPNVTKLAEKMYMTRGAISKLTKKLIKKELIKSYQRPDNQKERLFCLTEKGEQIFEAHERVNRTFRKRDQQVFEQVTAEQVAALLQFLATYNQHLDQELAKQQKQ